MSLDRKLKSKLLALMLDSRVAKSRRQLTETRRKLSGQRHVVSVFLQIDDPYSYILSHYLPSLAKHYDIELRLYLSQALGEEFQPEPGLLAEYSVEDCTRLAQELGIPFLDKGNLPPTEHRVALSDAVAALPVVESISEILGLVLNFGGFRRFDEVLSPSSLTLEPGPSRCDLVRKLQIVIRCLTNQVDTLILTRWGHDETHSVAGVLGIATSLQPAVV